jgi:hypothetical protein
MQPVGRDITGPNLLLTFLIFPAAGPSWASKKLSAIVNAACPALSSAASEEAAGSVMYLLGSAAAGRGGNAAPYSRAELMVVGKLGGQMHGRGKHRY